jgi:molybdopterin-guanine dinucleotide biosynthesis protein B
MKAIGIIGYSNTGKTTLIEKLIPLFTARGLRVAAIKNAHHGFDMDRPGKDSHRYREAGAAQVLIATSQRWALLTETPQRPATLEELLGELAPCDLVIIEGFKSDLSARRQRDRGGDRPAARGVPAAARSRRRH